MKRGAEKQLSKDDGDDIEQEDALEPRRGLQKADENVLAGRKIRGLPKRSSTISLGSVTDDDSTSTLIPEIPPVPKFGSFSGFGSSSTGSNLFTFTSSAPSTPPFGTPTSSTDSIFGATAPKPSVPSVSPSASGATKAFASVLSTPSVPAASSSKKDEVNPVALKYYSSLRGLNVSFLSAISKAVEQDPFTDVSDMVAHYKNFRISVQKEFDDKPKTAAQSSIFEPGVISGSTAMSSSLSYKPPTTMPAPPPAFTGAAAMPSSLSYKPPTTMPAPPATFSGFGKVSTPSSSTAATPPSEGFTPTAELTAPTTSSFSLPTPSTTPTASSSPAKSAFGSATNVPDFFSSSSSSSKPSTDSPPKPTSAFGLFSSSASPFSTKSTGPGDASSLFGGGTFGSPSKPPPGADKEKDQEIKAEPSPGLSSSLFGSSAATSNPFSIPDKPATSLFGPSPSPSIFGSPGSAASAAGATTAKPASIFGAFGSKSGTFGNPVGFGFGSAPKTPDGETPPVATPPTSVFGSKPSGFGGSTFTGFGAPPAKPAEASGSQEEAEEAGGSAIAASDVADDSKSSPAKNHDEEGEGEEEEETTHTTKSKVYKLHKKEDGAQEWKDLGVGMLRLKTHKTSGSRRVLLRNSGTGKITINFNIYSGLNPSLATKFITFVGHDEDGVSATYKLRTQSDQHAADLKNALDREIAFVKGKTE